MAATIWRNWKTPKTNDKTAVAPRTRFKIPATVWRFSTRLDRRLLVDGLARFPSHLLAVINRRATRCRRLALCVHHGLLAPNTRADGSVTTAFRSGNERDLVHR